MRQFLGRPRYRVWYIMLAHRYCDFYIPCITEGGQCFGNHDSCAENLKSHAFYVNHNCCGRWVAYQAKPSCHRRQKEFNYCLQFVCRQYLMRKPGPLFLHILKYNLKTAEAKWSRLRSATDRSATSSGLGLFHTPLSKSALLLTALFSCGRWCSFSRDENPCYSLLHPKYRFF